MPGKFLFNSPLAFSPDGARLVAIQADGKIVVAGEADEDIVLLRYTSTGILDSGFGNGGIATTHSTWGDANLPAWFLRNGYRTYALGKITHHPGGRTGKLWHDGPEELPGAWTRSWIPQTPWNEAENIMHGYANGVPRNPGKTPPTSLGVQASSGYRPSHV